MSGVGTIVRYGLEEALRRKVFVVVLLLTLAFLGLYGLANHYAFANLSGVAPPVGIDARTFAGAFIFGLAMFATLFLGVVLAVFLTATANGIAVFMLFGAGLVAGLLGTIGHALNSHAIQHASKVAAWALPFEALYQDGLRLISRQASGLTGFLLQLGPFGGAYVHGWGIRIWSVGYLCVALALALLAFRHRDL